MDCEGWTDAEERPNYPHAKFCADQFIYALGYAKKQPKEQSMERKALDNDYTSYCIVCNTNRVNKKNAIGVCPDCYPEWEKNKEKYRTEVEAAGNMKVVPDIIEKLYQESAKQLLQSKLQAEWAERNLVQGTGQQPREDLITPCDQGSTIVPDEFINTPLYQSEQIQFSSGAVRGTGCLPFHLITPHGILGMAVAFGEGAEKYSPYNNLKGFPLSNLYDHAMLHLLLFWWGDTSEDHLSHAIWNLNQIAFQQGKEDGQYEKLDDRPGIGHLTKSETESFVALLDEIVTNLKKAKQ